MPGRTIEPEPDIEGAIREAGVWMQNQAEGNGRMELQDERQKQGCGKESKRKADKRLDDAPQMLCGYYGAVLHS